MQTRSRNQQRHLQYADDRNVLLPSEATTKLGFDLSTLKLVVFTGICAETGPPIPALHLSTLP